jgi:hypothetical protein
MTFTQNSLLLVLFRNIIRQIKSRRIRWAGHVGRMGRIGMHIGLWWKSQKDRDHQEDLDVDRRIILKWTLGK